MNRALKPAALSGSYYHFAARAARRLPIVQCRGCASRTHEDDQAALAAAAADAEVDIRAFSAESWPDGTPKKFRGREAWKNWIDFDSPHTEQSDLLNRQRHYFFHVDERGRLWRKELHALEEHQGQLREPRILDFFFGHLQRNRTGAHEDRFPYVSFRAHEHYFTSCAEMPIVFNDLRDGELRHLCPDGELAASVSTRFDPSAARLTEDGKLVHPVITKAVEAVGGRPRSETLLALIESSTAQILLEHHAEEREGPDGDIAIVLRWCGVETVLRPLATGVDNGAAKSKSR